MVAPFSKFYGKFEVVFVLTKKTTLFLEVSFNRNSIGSSIKRYKGFSK